MNKLRYLNFPNSIVKFKKRNFTKKIMNSMGTNEMLKFEVSMSAFSKQEKYRCLLKNSELLNSPNNWLVPYVDKEFSRLQWIYAAPCYERIKINISKILINFMKIPKKNFFQWKINISLKKRKISRKYS